MKIKILSVLLILSIVYPNEIPHSKLEIKLEKSRVVAKRIMAGVGGGMVGALGAGALVSAATGEDELTTNTALVMMAGNAVGSAFAVHRFNKNSDYSQYNFKRTMIGSVVGSPLFLIPGLGLFGAPIGATIASTRDTSYSSLLTSHSPELNSELSSLVFERDVALKPNPQFRSLSMKNKATYAGLLILSTTAGGIVGGVGGGVIGDKFISGEHDEFGFDLISAAIGALVIAPTATNICNKWLKKE